jgi:exodeoxyribonuclease VII large subunit
MHLRRIHSLLAAYKPSNILIQRRRELRVCASRLKQAMDNQMNQLNSKMLRARRLIELLGPQQTLNRGYSITTAADGRILGNATQVAPGDLIRTRLARGDITSTVEEADGEHSAT